MTAFEPDCIIALGGGSAMDAGKIMWVLYEHPEVDFMDMAMRFMDIRKRVYTFPKMGEKAYFIAIPTSAGTGSEVTPFAVITDETHRHQVSACRLSSSCRTWQSSIRTSMMNAPKRTDRRFRYRRRDPRARSVCLHHGDRLHRRTGAQQALKVIFDYLPRAYENGADRCRSAREDGECRNHGGYGVCERLPRRLPLHGAQARRFPPPPARRCKRADD